MATSRFFMPQSASTWNSRNKSKVSLQRVNITSNAIQKTVRFSVIHCSLKINSHAQPGLNEEITSPSMAGRLVKGGLVFQQNVSVRSFEVDSENKMSTKAIMNYLQETSLNHAKKLGLAIETSFGITPGMRKMDLVWVFRGMHIEVDRYPSWGDVVQILHWCCASGRTGVRFDWTINDINTGESRVRASCLAVMMNKNTRKACTLPEEVEDEIKVCLRVDAEPIVEPFKFSCPQIEAMDHIKTGLTPGRIDLDVNYHVNNTKYLDWILESTPDSIKDRHELWKMNFQYRKECFKDDVIQSLSRVVPNDEKKRGIEVEHVLRLESGHQVLRANTVWRPNSPFRRGINNMKTLF